jgi:transposase
VAFNWGLARVKANLSQREAEASYGLAAGDRTPYVDWSFYGLRKAWNVAKDTVAPWWRENSKEAYATGLERLARALQNWSASRRGKRKGSKVGFPRFRSKHKAVPSVRFTTGRWGSGLGAPTRPGPLASCPSGKANSAGRSGSGMHARPDAGDG